MTRTSPVGCCTLRTGDLGSIPQETRSHMLQLKILRPGIAIYIYIYIYEEVMPNSAGVGMWE